MAAAGAVHTVRLTGQRARAGEARCARILPERARIFAGRGEDGASMWKVAEVAGFIPAGLLANCINGVVAVSNVRFRPSGPGGTESVGAAGREGQQV